MEKHSKDLLEAHLYHIRESLGRLESDVRSLTKAQRAHEKVLLRNTITVEDHRKRSDTLEANQATFVQTQQAMIRSIEDLTLKVKEVDLELQPIKKHVKTVSRLTSLLIAIDENKWTIAKIIGFIIVVGFTVYSSKGDILEILK